MPRAHTYLWESMRDDLLEKAFRIWSEPHKGTTGRQAACDFFGMRSVRRSMALNLLFPAGLYAEAYPLVRAAYEDWLSIAFILAGPADEGWREFQTDIRKHDARVHDAFLALCGREAAQLCFPGMPEPVRAYIGKPARETRPRSGMQWKAMAEAVGLGPIHPYIYTQLSDISHGGSRGFHLIFEGRKARIPERDQKLEALLAWWVSWFHLRIVTLAGREYGFDFESESDELITMVREQGLDTSLEGCVLTKERLGLNSNRTGSFPADAG